MYGSQPTTTVYLFVAFEFPGAAGGFVMNFLRHPRGQKGWTAQGYVIFIAYRLVFTYTHSTKLTMWSSFWFYIWHPVFS